MSSHTSNYTNHFKYLGHLILTHCAHAPVSGNPCGIYKQYLMDRELKGGRVCLPAARFKKSLKRWFLT